MSEAQLAIKQSRQHQTVIAVSERCTVGAQQLLIIGGPCSIENRQQMQQSAAQLAAAPVQMLRGGAFKPRTSPYSFQGLGAEGLKILAEAGQKHCLPVVTEVMSCEQVELVAQHADMLQIGSRNMQNFELLKAVGSINKPVMLKRGLAATLEEFVLAAEYILSNGNHDVVLCERGIRSFDSHTRNVLDLGGLVSLKQITHLPVIADPSHACGKRELVSDLARAAIAAGADGVMIECHPDPEQSVSDARQAISLEDMIALVDSLRPIAKAVGRSIADAPASNKVAPINAPLPISLGAKRISSTAVASSV